MERERPTMLAVHHTPLATGLPGWDAIDLAPAEREALAEDEDVEMVGPPGFALHVLSDGVLSSQVEILPRD